MNSERFLKEMMDTTIVEKCNLANQAFLWNAK